MEKGLMEGVQTKITPLVKKEAKKINGNGLEAVINILRLIHSDYKPKEKGASDKNLKKYPKRIRTAEELIQSKVLTGCTDYAHLFIALCRAKKIPALYVETFDGEWLKNPSNFIRGHIFAKVKFGGKTCIVDPTRGSINFVGSYGKYRPLAEGADYLTLFPTREKYLSSISKHFRIKKEVLR